MQFLAFLVYHCVLVPIPFTTSKQKTFAKGGSRPNQADVAAQVPRTHETRLPRRNKRTLPRNPSFTITNDKFTGEAAHFALCLCYFSLCLFSPTFFSCRLDSSKFRAVTLREGFWQRRVVMEDRLPLQVPCRENPGRAARRIAADDLRCCSAGCCRASSCASLVSARPSPARECLQSVRRCYFGVGVKEHL